MIENAAAAVGGCASRGGIKILEIHKFRRSLGWRADSWGHSDRAEPARPEYPNGGTFPAYAAPRNQF